MDVNRRKTLTFDVHIHGLGCHKFKPLETTLWIWCLQRERFIKEFGGNSSVAVVAEQRVNKIMALAFRLEYGKPIAFGNFLSDMKESAKAHRNIALYRAMYTHAVVASLTKAAG